MATIMKRNSTYKITVSAGYDINGKQIRKHLTWKPAPGMTAKQIEKELDRQVHIFEEKVHNGLFLDGSIKFADFAEKWFKDYAQKQLKPATLQQYKYLLTRINHCIGHIRLDKLRPHHLIALYEELAKDGIRNDTKCKCKIDFKAYLKEHNITKVHLSKSADVCVSTLNSITQGKNINFEAAEKICKVLKIKVEDYFELIGKSKLSDNTLMRHHAVISSILSTAVHWQIIENNPCDRVKPPKVKKIEPKYLDDIQSKQLLKLLENESIQRQTMIQLLIFLGLRRGELLGLKWQDIDFKQSLVNIRRTIQYIPKQGIIENDTKNAYSQRVIKVPDYVIDILKKYKIWQTAERLKVGDCWHNTDYIFTKFDGTPLHPDNLSGWFRKFIKKNGLPDINIHSLRHTNATLQIANHIPLTTVANRLGHANANTTTKIYAHAIRSADEAAAEAIQNILIPTKEMKQA